MGASLQFLPMISAVFEKTMTYEGKSADFVKIAELRTFHTCSRDHGEYRIVDYISVLPSATIGKFSLFDGINNDQNFV